MVMELIEGGTLKDRLFSLSQKGNLLPFEEAVRIFRETLGALAYAHGRNMIHRDVKPSNLMLDREDNRVVLTDFGNAKILTGAHFTADGGMVGTPAYMAPEQGLGEMGDVRSDLYALGVIFYQMLTGSLPYDAETPLAVILKHINAPIPSVLEMRPELPFKVDQLIKKLLAKEPNERYQSAGEVLNALDAIETNKGKGRRIFISYKRVDWDRFVEPLIAHLRAENLDWWVDQHLIEGGDDWMDEINRALKECECMILCVSPEALESRHVKMEYRYFFNIGKPIYPLICRLPDELPAELQIIQHYPYTELDRLLQQIKLRSRPA